MVQLFAASFVFIALRAFQQLNVQHDRRLLVVPTSLIMAVAEVSVISGIVRENSLWTALPVGLGAGLGCLLAMDVHRRLRK